MIKFISATSAPLVYYSTVHKIYVIYDNVHNHMYMYQILTGSQWDDNTLYIVSLL